MGNKRPPCTEGPGVGVGEMLDAYVRLRPKSVSFALPLRESSTFDGLIFPRRGSNPGAVSERREKREAWRRVLLVLLGWSAVPAWGRRMSRGQSIDDRGRTC